MFNEAVTPTGTFEVPDRSLGAELWGHRFHMLEQENAIAQCNAASTLCTSTHDPKRWASLQINLARIYQGRQAGARYENLEQAMQHCQNALQVRTRDNLPVEWAVTHATLGNVYTHMGCSANAFRHRLEQALEHYHYALQVLTEEAFPTYWATIQQGLSATYIWRVNGKKPENLQQSIAHGQAALRLLTQATTPFEWAATHAHLGEAYRQATSYADLQKLYSGRPVMQEQAIRHLEAALQVYTRYVYPLEWTNAQRFLGLIYLERVQGRRHENLAQARACFEAYLQVFNDDLSLPTILE